MALHTKGQLVCLSEDILFFIHKVDGIRGLGLSGQIVISIEWDDEGFENKMIALISDHPMLYHFLPRRVKSNKAIKSAYLLSMLEK